VTLQEALRAVARLPVPVVTALDGEGRGAATTLALWSDATVAFLTTPLGFPGATVGLLPLGALTALRVRAEAREHGLQAPLRAEFGVVSALTAFLASERVESAQRAGISGLLGDRWLATMDRDGLLDAAAGLARALARSVPRRPLGDAVELGTAGEQVTAGLRLAELEPAARQVVEALVRAVRRSGNVDDLLAAERAVLRELLRDGEYRQRTRATLQALAAARR
jgi:3-hydroxyacyl-CoA dehydrogenase